MAAIDLMHNNGRARARRTRFVAAAALAAAAVTATVALAGIQAVPAPANASKEPTAAEILVLAIARQGAPKDVPAGAELPLALHAKTNLQYRDDKGLDINVDAERRFLAPDRIWTRATETATKTETVTGYDGKRPWFYDPTQKPPVRWLDGADGERDLKQLAIDVELTSALARAFLLRRLQAELTDVKRLDDVQHRDETKKTDLTAWVVEGVAQLEVDHEKKRTLLRLYVENQEHHLIGVHVAIEGREPMQIWFRRHQDVRGVDVPRTIEVFREGAKQPQTTLIVNDLDLAPHYTDADFAPPAPGK